MNIKNLLEIRVKQIKPETIKMTKKTRIWCQLSYNGKKQCPNYGESKWCPPNAPFMEDLPKKYKYYYLVYGIFNLRKYVIEMSKIHQEWSEKQLRCVFYYQPQIKKLIHSKCMEFNNVEFLLGSGSGYANCYSMESAGINVFALYKLNGIEFEVKPINKAVFCSLICSNKKIINTKIKQTGLL